MQKKKYYSNKSVIHFICPASLLRSNVNQNKCPYQTKSEMMEAASSLLAMTI